MLVGLGVADDAAVFRLNDAQAIIQTADFFTPIVDTAYEFGAIAAANAMSDVYAMGGEVLFAINLAAFPADLPMGILTEILRGGAEMVQSVGAVIAGGHTIQDKEPKYGMAVTGIVHPAHIFTKGGARPGDRLVLTKPLGTGTITTAVKRGTRGSGASRRGRGQHDAPQSGGLAGGPGERRGRGDRHHRVRPARPRPGDGRSRRACGCVLPSTPCPGCPAPWHMPSSGFFPGGAHNNHGFYNSRVVYSRPVLDWQETLLHDPQTSGGLLIAVAADKIDDFLAFCAGHEQPAWVIGDVSEGAGIEII